MSDLTYTPSPAQAAPRPARVAWTLILASIGAFVTSLDVVVVAVALPTLRSHLHASLSDLEWTVNAYNLAFAALMLTGAALGDRFGRRKLYACGLALFSAGSVACALSGSTGTLITARVVQGAGAAVVLPLTLTLISEAFPAEKRGSAIGIWGGITGLGVAAGPLLGGAIIQGISWQWIFWINVPIGGVSAVLSAFLLKESRGPRPQLDLVGLPIAALGLFALVWAPARAPSIGWRSGEVIGSLVAGVVLIGAFLAWERRARYPMLPLAYFRRRGFSAAGGVAFFLSFSLIGSVFWIAQLFQTGLGYGPLKAGVYVLVFTAMPMLVAPIAGLASDKIGNRPFMAGGLILMGTGLGWLGLDAKPGVSYATLILPLIVSGIGISCVFPTLANAAVGSVPVQDAGVAAGANNTVRETGGLFGVAVLAAVFAAHGSYESAAAFMHGFRYALLVAAAVALAGSIAGFISPSKADARAAGRITTAPSPARPGSPPDHMGIAG